MNFDHILRDIFAAVERVPEPGAQVRLRELQKSAAREFARLNGWKLSAKDFALRCIGQRSGRFDLNTPSIFDHCLYFRSAAGCAAIVAQPYDHNSYLSEAYTIADHYGLDRHLPTDLTASIWYPTRTLFIVFTERSHTIQWLPEQVSGLGEVSHAR